ncbi:MAG TPA: substrate-binding domain-containing protein, partial [Arthrobacter sp.]|nr:substrate-binding domain-containing protein [Arthrobacter sp.]
SVETEHLRRVKESNRPLVLLDRSAGGLAVETVAVDMAAISYEATNHLLDSGHRRIAFISTLSTDTAAFSEGMRLDSSQISDRLEGMRRAFADAGHSFPDDLVRLNAGDAGSIRKLTREVLLGAKPATAVVASDGLIALSVVEAIQEAGLRIPEDVSFLMYDDFAWTRLTTPPLTVVSQPVYEMGAAAAAALIRQIEGRPPLVPAPEFNAALVRRGSVGAVPESAPPHSVSPSDSFSPSLRSSAVPW